MIAARKIGAPDATREKYVTTKKKPVLGGIEAQAPRAVTRNEQNAKRDATKFGLRRLLNQEIGLDRLCFEKEPQFFVKFGIGHHRNTILMERGPALGSSLDLGCVIEVVDVPVSDQKQIDSYPEFSHPVR